MENEPYASWTDLYDTMIDWPERLRSEGPVMVRYLRAAGESIPFLVDFRRLLLSSFQATFALCCNPSASLSASRSNGKWR